VIYPIIKLDGKGFGPNHDIGGFLRKFEQILIDELAARGIQAESRENAAGVWAGNRKIASMGIAIRKWVTYHGMAVNCVNDLKYFQLISPCGFSPEVMTKLSDLLKDYDVKNWRTDLEQAFARRMRDASEGSQTNQTSEIRKLTAEQAFAEAMALDPGIELAGNSNG
jgi:lipoate-protein ligase B